jgi:outer membrane protein TolC
MHQLARRPAAGEGGQRRAGGGIAAIGLAGCASFEGIGTDKQPAQAGDFTTARSLSDPTGAPNGQWPGSDWVRQFGDAQLTALIEEALAANPSLQQARARIGAAAALAESRGARCCRP